MSTRHARLCSTAPRTAPPSFITSDKRARLDSSYYFIISSTRAGRAFKSPAHFYLRQMSSSRTCVILRSPLSPNVSSGGLEHVFSLAGEMGAGAASGPRQSTLGTLIAAKGLEPIMVLWALQLVKSDDWPITSASSRGCVLPVEPLCAVSRR